MKDVKQIKEILEQEYGWGNLDSEDTKWFVDELIKDVVDIVNLNTDKNEK